MFKLEIPSPDTIDKWVNPRICENITISIMEQIRNYPQPLSGSLKFIGEKIQEGIDLGGYTYIETVTYAESPTLNEIEVVGNEFKFKGWDIKLIPDQSRKVGNKYMTISIFVKNLLVIENGKK